jgi:regulator of CtrA degradation
MSTNIKTSDDAHITGVTVSFGEHFAASEQFDGIFKEGMALVERTAAYLDGNGRKEAKALKGPIAVLYATESMRLTTRLLELASWLMIRRAQKDGEITADEARSKRDRVRLKVQSRPAHITSYAELPQGLRDLIDASFSLNDRIVQLDRAMEVVVGAENPVPVENPVTAQMSLLEQAFAPRRQAQR